MRLAYQFQGQKVKVTRPINADAHPAAYLPIRTHSIPSAYHWLLLFDVFLGHFRINLHQTRMRYSNEWPQHCNWAQFSKIAFWIYHFVAEKQLFVDFGHLSSSNLLLADPSIDDAFLAHCQAVDAERSIAHKSETNSPSSVTKIDKMVLHGTCYIAHQF